MSVSNLMDTNVLVVKNATKLGKNFKNVSAIYPGSKSNKCILIVHFTDVGPTSRVSKFQTWKLSKDNQKVLYIQNEYMSHLKWLI